MKLDKPGGFIGREALLRQQQAGLAQAPAAIQAASRREPLLYHNEPIWRGEIIVGYIRSGMYAHTLGAAVGLGYVAVPRLAGARNAAVDADGYEIEVAGVRYPAIASLRPLYDPKNERIK